LSARWLGCVPYGTAAGLQEALVEARRQGAASDTLLLLEHPPVITLGRGADPRHVVADPAALRAAGVETHECGRGGDVTYHAPGQLVGWPVLALPPERRDAHRYLRELEDGLIAALRDFGIQAGREAGLTGVWADGRKVAAIGVRLSSGWITSHGFALNVNTDLDGFGAIVPCGIVGREVTSMERLLSQRIPLPTVAARVAARVAQALGCQLCHAEDPLERLPEAFLRQGAAA
jgi:lipoyl(octanoyl) transferase